MSENANDFFFGKKTLSQKVPTDMDNAVLETLSENFGQKPKFFRSMFKNDVKNTPRNFLIDK